MPGLGATGLITLPGQNGAQQAMAGSINKVCPTITNIAMGTDPPTQGQIDLATICQVMTFNALQVQNQPNVLPLPKTSFGLDASQLNGALQQLNGGAELLVPTSQASVVQTTQTSRQTGAIEKRLNELRNWTNGTVVAAIGSPWVGQVAALNTLGPGGQGLFAQNEVPPLAYSIGPFGVFLNGFGQFGSRDLTTTENGYSFNNAGFVAGADYRLTPRLVAGLAFGYSQSNTNFDTSAVSAAGQSLNGNLLQGNLYATYSVTDAWYVNAIGLIGGGNNDSQRHIAFGTNGFDATTGTTNIAIDRVATGNFGSRVGGVTVASGYELPFGPLLLTPIARFLYQHTGVKALSEEGALGADLQFGRSAWPEARVVTAPTIKPLRFSISAWPTKHSRASLPGPLRRRRASGSVVEACVSFLRRSPLKSRSPLRPGPGSSPEPSLARKLFGLAQASSKVPLTEK
jgi:uncharacterized protein with beta-barrel porin domain